MLIFAVPVNRSGDVHLVGLEEKIATRIRTQTRGVIGKTSSSVCSGVIQTTRRVNLHTAKT